MFIYVFIQKYFVKGVMIVPLRAETYIHSIDPEIRVRNRKRRYPHENSLHCFVSVHAGVLRYSFGRGASFKDSNCSTSQIPLVEDYDTNAFILWLEETTGIDVNWMQIPASSFADRSMPSLCLVIYLT